ncbi:MAG: hypothetical protein LBD06_09155 [Candidatus Accumulibacter sp.]|nr:hypothetical protein [Accumulibacter sp.]
MRTHYVLIDFENVQPASLEPLRRDHCRLLIFVGANQTRISVDVAASVQQLGSHAEYVKISGNGPNALDFHIAYYIGKLASEEPTAFFHIVSRDTGFDPLISHLKGKGVSSDRVKSITDIPMIRASAAKTLPERIDMAHAWLQQPQTPKPRTVKTLSAAIASLFQKRLSDEEIDAIVQALAAQGHIAIAGSNVTYASAEPAETETRSTAPAPAPSDKMPAERVDVARAWLQRPEVPKPRTVKTLGNAIASLFQKRLSDEEVGAIVQALAAQGHIAIAGTRVSCRPFNGADS